MYIHPFVAGVLSTLIFEIVIMFVYAAVETHKRNRK